MAGSVAAASTGGGWKARLEARVAAPTTLAPSTDVRPIGSAEPDGDRGDGRSGRQRRRRRRGGGAEGNEEFARYQRREEAEEAATLRERQERLAAQCDDDGPWVVRSLPPGCADAPASNAAARGAHGDSESDANAVTDDAASALTRRVPCVRPATLLSCATLVDDAATCGRTLGDVLAAAGHNVVGPRKRAPAGWHAPRVLVCSPLLPCRRAECGQFQCLQAVGRTRRRRTHERRRPRLPRSRQRRDGASHAPCES